MTTEPTIMFELNNKQREYFGLEPVKDNWEKVTLKGDAYRPESILYFENDIIKKHILSSETEYREKQYNEKTENREFILPKTKKGKPKKLTASVLESKTPIGVYLFINKSEDLTIGNHTTQTTFYSSRWEKREESKIEAKVTEFINSSPENHLEEISQYKTARRKNIKYKAGDFFAYKISRKHYGFGRILFDVNKARKKKLIEDNHGLNMLMGPPVLIKLYSYISETKDVELNFLKEQVSLPSDYIMDNVIFYGEFEIIGNIELEEDEIEFPISYGRKINMTPNAFLQWGLIHKEIPLSQFKKYTNAIKENLPENDPNRVISNPYGYYGIGFRPKINFLDLQATIKNNNSFDFSKGNHYQLEWDLRNPKNNAIRIEILKKFGLDPSKGYMENATKSKTKHVLELIKEMK